MDCYGYALVCSGDVFLCDAAAAEYCDGTLGDNLNKEWEGEHRWNKVFSRRFMEEFNITDDSLNITRLNILIQIAKGNLSRRRFAPALISPSLTSC